VIRRILAVALVLAASNGVGADESVSAPFITSPDEVVHRMLQLAHTGPDDVVVDLGSGDGRIVIAAAQKFGARGLGIEIDAGLVKRSRDNALKAGVAHRVTFQKGDVLAADISAASVVTVYLLPGLINRLPPVFLRRLNPGTRIVSHAFAMAGWRPDAVETVRISQPHPGQGPESTLYLWVVPAEVRGIWGADGRQADGTRIRIHQNFQEVELEGQLFGREISASRASLRGRDLMWEANGLRFEGRLQGEVITGELAGPDGRQPFALRRAR
jgi:protein-L-isoaspartate O-methyltransferase